MKIVSSKLLLKAGLLSFASLLLASSAFSQSGGRGLSPGGGNHYTWSCRASDDSSSGLFYFGVNADRDAAEDKALSTCLRFVDSCNVDCEKLQF